MTHIDATRASQRVQSQAQFGFGHLCGVAERMDDAVAEGGAEFRRLACAPGREAPGREETLLAPELAPNRGERVGEGGPLLAVPGGGRDLEPGVAAEAGGEQGHDGEQAEQAGRGAGDRPVRPLPLGLDAEVVADLSEGDLQPPSLDEPADDLQRLLRCVST
jgi:hypothetical protein